MTAPYAVPHRKGLDVIAFLMVLAVLGVVFGVAVVLTGRAEGMSEEHQDFADTGIPRDRAMTPQDVIGLRFALAFRGYRMAEVDDALDRLAAELAARDEAIARLRAAAGGEEQRVEEQRVEEQPYVPSDATGDVPSGTPVDEPLASPWARPPAAEAAADEPEYVPSDATGDLPPGVETEVTPPPDAGEPQPDEPEFVAPEPAEPVAPAGAGAAGGLGVGEAPALPEFAEPEAEPEPEPEPAPAPEPPARRESPIFGALASGSLRPEVPEIPTYDPWAVTPRSRYTDGPTFVEVDDHDDDDPTEAIAEHQTGYAPPPPAPAEPATEPAEQADGDEPRAWPS
jgi:DivIVA domain-containing protein